MNRKNTEISKAVPDYLILSAGFGVGEGGFACGPVAGPVAAEVKLSEENGAVFYVSLVEPSGMPHFFRTEESILDKLLEEYPEEWDEDDIQQFYDDIHADNLLLAADDYSEIFEDYADEPLYPVYRYLIWLVRCDSGEEERFIEESKNRWIRELAVPKSDVEVEMDE